MMGETDTLIVVHTRSLRAAATAAQELCICEAADIWRSPANLLTVKMVIFIPELFQHDYLNMIFEKCPIIAF